MRECRDYEGISCPPGKTREEFAKDADVNEIVRRLLRGEPQPEPRGSYADCVGVPDFHGALEKRRVLMETFNGLPAAVRRRLGGDPMELVSRLSTPEGRDELVAMGLDVRAADGSSWKQAASGAPGAPSSPKGAAADEGSGATGSGS